jgi:protein-histidine pros-kinase
MGLRLRFNLILTVIFALGLTVSGFVCHDLLQRHAREEVVHTAELMIEAAQAFRAYTVNEIRPLLEDQLHDTFLPQTVPAYAATQALGDLSAAYREFLYKEATLNPTNPRDRAAD